LIADSYQAKNVPLKIKYYQMVTFLTLDLKFLKTHNHLILLYFYFLQPSVRLCIPR